MTEEQQCRMDFEAWAGGCGMNIACSAHVDEYIYHSTHSAWMAWLAARSKYAPVSLPVDLDLDAIFADTLNLSGVSTAPERPVKPIR